MTRKITSALLACVFAGLSALTLHAADTTLVSTLITVSCEAEDNDQNTAVIEPVDEGYRYTIKEDTLSFTGTETKSFVLEFTEPGNYYYKVHQSAGLSTSEHMDNKTHSVKVYVSWDGNGNLVATPVIYLEGEQEKEMEVGFLNVPKAHYIDNANDIPDTNETNTSDTGEKETILQTETTETNTETNTEAKAKTNTGTNTEVYTEVNTGNVQTGDTTPVLEVWIILLGSAVAIIAMASRKSH